MKFKLFTILTIISLATNINAQEIMIIDTTQWLCIYKYEFLQDSTSKYSLKQIDMSLQVGTHISKFESFNDFLSDSILYENRNLELNENNAQTILSQLRRIKDPSNSSLLAKYTVYKNYPISGFISFYGYDDHKFFKVTQQNQLKWMLAASKDTVIASYICKKATTTFAGRNYIAWYTRQIPVNDGPYKFSGLPGLIVKLYDNKNLHCFTLTSFKKINYNQLITLSKQKYIEITPQEYVNVVRNKVNRLSGNIQSGSITILSDEGKARSLQGLKSKNNFIEKY